MSLLFFGAGASRPFGIPTMQEMVSDFEEKLKQTPEIASFYEIVKKSLTDQYGSSKIDIEAMLSVLQGIADGVEPKDLGHFTYFYMKRNCSNNKFSGNEILKAKDLVNRLKQYIKNSCTVALTSQDRTKIYEKSYLPLFRNLPGENENYHGKFKLSRVWKAYTTNYDNIFEGFWESFYEPETHFDRQGVSNNYIFNSSKTLGTQSFSKLHGSLNWTRIIENGNVIRSSPSGFTTFETEGEVMLYPIQQKDLYLHPWFTLFQDFKNGLVKFARWYVIGYAFNDEFIFNVFEEALKSNSKELVIINPDAESLRRKFSRELWDKIVTLPFKFGNDSFDHNFSDFQLNKRYIEVTFETNSSSFQFECPPSIEFYGCDMNKGKYEGHVQKDEKSNFIFTIKNDDIIKGKIYFDMSFDYKNKEPLDFKFQTNSQTEIKIELKSKSGTYYDIFTTKMKEPRDQTNSHFVYTRSIPTDNFLR